MSDQNPAAPTPKYQIGEKVNLLIVAQTPLGFKCLINEDDEGILYASEVFEELRAAQRTVGYVKKIRDDGKIDLILQPLGSKGSIDIGAKILKLLKEKNGFLPINDKTEPEDIYDLFGVSKKKYKMALGGLYKKRLITVEPTGIRLVSAGSGKPGIS